MATQEMVRLVVPPPPPTSERPEYDVLYTTADRLNSDVLLTIFDHYRLDDEGDWNGQQRWCKLAHVCQKWRQVIFDSPSRLNIRIHFTFGARPLDKLSHLRSIPLAINYRSAPHVPYLPMRKTQRDAEDDDSGILHALQQYDRTRYIVLDVPSEALKKLIVPMDRPFPRLETLSLLSQTIPNNDTTPSTLMLPRGFLAPNLRHLELRCISLPTGLPFLASTPFLVILKLANIQTSTYFSPEDLVTQLRHLPQLEELSIDFSIPLPDPDDQEELYRAPMTPTVLPSLRSLALRGVCAYLEGLVGRICAPRLECFPISLFYEPTFTIGHLSEFIKATEGIRGPVVTVAFVSQDGAIFSVTSRDKLIDSSLSLYFHCNQFYWQVHSMTQVCAALAPILSVSELSVQCYQEIPPLPLYGEQHRPSGGQIGLDNMMWHELLRPFNDAKSLNVNAQLAVELSCALEADDAGLIPWLLPELQELGWNGGHPRAGKAFTAFINTRQSAGRPISLLPSPQLTPWKWRRNMPTPHANDLLVDGFIPHMFSPGDAYSYFSVLFKTPDFMRYYGISYSEAVWYIVQNTHRIMPPLRGAPVSDPPLPLDFDVRKTEGTIVPQCRWMPTDKVDHRRFVQGATLQLPIFFVNRRSGGVGFRLPDILWGHDHDLSNRGTQVPLGETFSIYMCISWPGCDNWTAQIMVRDRTSWDPITLARFMKHVGTSVDRFLDRMAHERVANDRWRIGTNGITRDHIKIIGVVHVSAGHWMPILQLTQHLL